MNNQLETLIARILKLALVAEQTNINESSESWVAYLNEVSPANVRELIAALEQSQTKLDATEAVALALRDDSRLKDKSIAELEKQYEDRVPTEWAYNQACKELQCHKDEIAKLKAGMSSTFHPVMFIDGDISPSDAEKLANVITEWAEEDKPKLPRTAAVMWNLSAQAKHRTTSENVSDVLEAIRVMSQNHQPKASQLAVKLTDAIIDNVCMAASEIHNRGDGVNDDKAQFIIDRIRNYLENGGTVQGDE